MILAVHNPKGGVGRTTTAVNLAAAFAGAGRRALLVDLEPFASASLSLGVRPQQLRPSIADVLLNQVRAAEAVRSVAGAPNLHLLTGSIGMATFEATAGQRRRSDTSLADAIRPLNALFDIIVLDTPAGLSLTGVSALAAAQHLIVPVQAEYLAIEGLAHYLRWYQDLRTRRKGLATLLGIVLTMIDYRQQATREIVDILRAHNRGGVFATEIPRDTRVPEAPSHGLPLLAYARRSRAALAYEKLAGEIRKRLARRIR